jgi:hypothetical protein
MWLSRLNSQWVLVPAVAVIVLLAWWLRTRDRRAQRALIVASVILALVCLVQFFRPETPAEAMKRKTEAMANAVSAKELDKIFQHVSENFDRVGKGKTDKATMRAAAQRILDSGELTEVKVWGFKDEKVDRGAAETKPTGTIEFTVKPKGPNLMENPGYRCVAQFVFDDDRQWRLQGFTVYPSSSNQEVDMPVVPIP